MTKRKKLDYGFSPGRHGPRWPKHLPYGADTFGGWFWTSRTRFVIEGGGVSKGRERQRAKREIAEEMTRQTIQVKAVDAISTDDLRVEKTIVRHRTQ